MRRRTAWAARPSLGASTRAAIALLAAACLLAATAAPAARAQRPTPGPPPTATPPGRISPQASVVGDLPECAFGASLRASDEIVGLGEPVTMTFTADIVCPELLSERAVVLVVGSRTEAALQDTRASLAALVAALATGVRTRLAIVEVGAAGGAPAWAATPAEIAALDGRVRGLGVQTVLDDVAWLAALDTAGGLLGSARLSEQPLLVVLDCWGPASGQPRVMERLQDVASAVRDAAGHVWLLDRSPAGWLVGGLFDPNEANSGVIGLFPAADPDESLESLTRRLVASAAARIDLIHVTLSLRMPSGVRAPVTEPLAATSTPTLVTWVIPGTGRRQAVRLTAVVRMVGADVIGLAGASVNIERAAPAIRSGRTLTGIRVCVEPGPPAPRQCGLTPTPRPSATRTPSPSATATPTPHPTLTAHANATRTAFATRGAGTPPAPATATRPRLAVVGRAWLPALARGFGWATPLPTMPPPTEVPRPGATVPRPGSFAILGRLPTCDVNSTVRSSAAIVRAGEPLTVTISVRAQCPQLLDDRAAVVILGGFKLSAEPDVRRALHHVVETFVAAPGSRLALLAVDAPDEGASWAITPDDFRALDERIERIRPHDAYPSADWHTVLTAAETLLARDGLQRRPLVIVLDGAGAQSDQTAVTAHTLRLAVAAGDAAGHCLLVDHSIGGRLFLSTPRFDPTRPSLVVVVTDSSSVGTLEGVFRLALGALGATLDHVAVNVLTMLPSSSDPPVTVPPATSASPDVVTWFLPAEGHSARRDLTLTLRSDVPASHEMPTFLSVVRVGMDALDEQQTSLAAVTSFCVAAPAPAPLSCQPPAPTMLPFPTDRPPSTPGPTPTLPRPRAP